MARPGSKRTLRPKVTAVSASPQSGQQPADLPEVGSSVLCRLRGCASAKAGQLLVVAVLVAGVWWLMLAALALLTANPVTLNRVHVRQADCIVTATVSDLDRDTLTVNKAWKQRIKLDRIIVENLKQTDAKPGQSYLMPLSRIANNRYRITPTPLPENPPIIYPATPEALQQLNELLNEFKELNAK